MRRAFPAIIATVAVLLANLVPPVTLAAPAEPVATVVAVRGSVAAKNAKGVERPLAMKSPIFQDDVLKTGGTGRLQLMFTDNSIISLGGGSEMKIAEYRWQPEQKDGALKTQIKEGTFRVMGGALTKDAPQNFKTETPTATIGIRGSMYAGNVTPTTLSVVFQGGQGINVTNQFGTVAITRPGFGTRVALNAAPLPPVKFTEKELGDLNKQLNGNGKKEDKGAAPGEEKGGTKGEKSAADEQEGKAGGEGPPPAQQPAAPTAEGATAQAPSPTPTPPSPEPQPPPPIEALALLPPPTPPPLPPLGQLSPLTPPAQRPVVQIVQQVQQTVSTAQPVANELPSAPSYATPTGTPTDGIYLFSGGLGGISVNSSTGTTETITGDVYMAANWHNNTILGAVFDPVSSSSTQKDSPVFFFGHASGSNVTDIQIFGFGEGGPSTDIAAIAGSGSGLFFGSAYDFFNFDATGASYLVKGNPQTLLDSWTVQGAAQQVIGQMQPTAPTGTETWEGFVVGVGEDMNDPNINRRLFLNNDPSTFAFAIDKDNGTITGAMATNVNTGSGYQISGMQVGNSGSAYIADKFLAAILDCPGGNCMGGTAGLKTYGNYMVVEDPEKQWSSFFTWGYWEAAYVDPNDSTQRHIHVPYSMWIAGKPTLNQPAASYSGTYNGNVRATLAIAGGSATALDGTISIPVDFSLNSIPAAGTMSLSNGTTFSIAATGTAAFNFPAGKFTTTISGDGTSGNLNGAFYGPNAEAMAGNFYSSTAGKQYIGIFGANR
jgi:hypothetical protein